jgi:ligand-binding SRPBCC domain-containing protein
VPTIRIETKIQAPIELCFDLARDIDLHVQSMRASGERAVAGVTTGLIGLGDEVTWDAIHFGVRQRLTSRITAFDRPRSFRDSQVRGAFRRFDHDHLFDHESGVTTMRDLFDYTAPMGLLGCVADLLFLERYMRRILMERATVIRDAAERASL